MRFKPLFLLLVVVSWSCENDGNTTDRPCPVDGIELPASSASAPVEPGTTLTVRGTGFAPDCEIWLRAVQSPAETVEAEITQVTETSLDFTAPQVSGRQTVELRQDGGSWVLGELTFPAEEERPLEILPRRVSHIRVTWPEDQTFVRRYTYDAEGRITTITTTDRQNNYEGASDEPFEDESITIEYAPGRIVETDERGAVSTYELTDGRTTAIIAAPGGGSYPDDCTYTYDAEGYVSGSTWAETGSEEDELLDGKCTYTVVDGNLAKWNDDDGTYVTEYTIRYDSERPNNLNIDLFGVDEFTFEHMFNHIYLFGAGGCRLRSLPSRIDEKDGDTEIFRYEMDGEYISKIEISDADDCLTTLLEFFYE